MNHLKIITQYKKGQPILENIDIYTLSVNSLSSHQPEAMEINELLIEMKRLQQINKRVYLFINRFLFEPELTNAIEIVKIVIQAGIDGLIVNDFGWSMILQELNFDKEVILQTDTTVTNSLEAASILVEGFNKVVIARELTIEEIIEMAQDLGEQIIVPIFGHQIMSTSRRLLLDAYGNEVNRVYKSNRFYHLKESTRQDPYLIYQDDTGTHIFDGTILCGYHELKTLAKSGCNYVLLDSLNIDSDMIEMVSTSIKAILNGQDADTEFERLQNNYPHDVFSNALWFKKTSDKKVANE